MSSRPHISLCPSYVQANPLSSSACLLYPSMPCICVGLLQPWSVLPAISPCVLHMCRPTPTLFRPVRYIPLCPVCTMCRPTTALFMHVCYIHYVLQICRPTPGLVQASLLYPTMSCLYVGLPPVLFRPICFLPLCPACMSTYLQPCSGLSATYISLCFVCTRIQAYHSHGWIGLSVISPNVLHVLVCRPTQALFRPVFFIPLIPCMLVCLPPALFRPACYKYLPLFFMYVVLPASPVQACLQSIRTHQDLGPLSRLIQAGGLHATALIRLATPLQA